MVYEGTSYLKRWMRTGSTPISGNLQVFYNVLGVAPPVVWMILV